MQDQLITNRRFGLSAISIAAFSILVTLVSGNILFALISCACASVSLALWKYGYILVPVLVQRMHVVEVLNEYEIPPTQDTITKKINNRFYATCFLSAKITESITEKSGAEKAIFVEYFERAVASTKYVCKFSVMVANINLSSYEDEIKTKRNFAETMKSRLVSSGSANMPEITRLEREIVMWNRQLKRLAGGERPMEVICYLSTTSCAISREEAVARAKMQANEIKASVGNALNVEISLLKGEDMKKCFLWEYALPANNYEMADSLYNGII